MNTLSAALTLADANVNVIVYLLNSILISFSFIKHTATNGSTEHICRAWSKDEKISFPISEKTLDFPFPILQKF